LFVAIKYKNDIIYVTCLVRRNYWVLILYMFRGLLNSYSTTCL